MVLVTLQNLMVDQIVVSWCRKLQFRFAQQRLRIRLPIHVGGTAFYTVGGNYNKNNKNIVHLKKIPRYNETFKILRLCIF